MDFKNYLLTESKDNLMPKVGDLLSSAQSLSEDIPNLGPRDVATYTSLFVNQIRKILHGSWDDSDKNILKVLQKIGVNLAKAVEEKGDVPALIEAAVAALEKISEKTGKPINDVASDEKPEEQDEIQEFDPKKEISA